MDGAGRCWTVAKDFFTMIGLSFIVFFMFCPYVTTLIYYTGKTTNGICCQARIGTDLRCIQYLPGHESSKTTEIYTHITIKGFDQIKRPLDKLNIK
jgi:hypothetical protein